MYQPRTYRRWIKDDNLITFNVIVRETDLYIRASSNLEVEATAAVIKYRRLLEDYIQSHPLFLHSLEPCAVPDDAPDIIKVMAQSSGSLGIGPMAAVAGAIAEVVGRDLLVYSPEVIVENGGDIFMKVLQTKLIGIYAGESPFTGKIALEISPQETPLGICTSSGTVGPSLSLGTADAVIVLSRSAALADSAATAIGNKVITVDDVDTVIEWVKAVLGLVGVIIIKGDRMGMWGDVKIVPLDSI
jgi:ApbE superfamily uncharacterized protein (UPF0280 family)